MCAMYESGLEKTIVEWDKNALDNECNKLFTFVVQVWFDDWYNSTNKQIIISYSIN